MKRPIELVEDILEDAMSTGSDRARGRFGGHEVELRMIDRGAGSTRDPYTEVWFLGAAQRPDLEIHVIPQTDGDLAEAAVGRGTDVIVGEPLFDEAFFVEAAPADVVTRLFDPAIRERMLALGRVGVHTHSDGLLVETPGWDDEAGVRHMVELGDALARRVLLAFAEADREHASREGYRGMVSSEARDAARRAEVGDVLARKGARDQHRQTMGCISVAVILAVCAVIAALAAQCDHGSDSSYETYE